ncbi:MAG: flagellar protein FlaG [Calditerrivibrio sp.]|nr:flagellar protein FlaG [Calditerrivibrio sp.]
METVKIVSVDMVRDPQVASKVKSNDQYRQEARPKEATDRDLERVVKDINDTFANMNIARQFEIDRDLDKVVVKIMDTEKKEVIRQIPSEDTLRISKNIKEMLGLLFDTKY